MTPQSSFMIVDAVGEGRLERLRERLDAMNASPGLADPGNATLPFGRFERLHSARFVILELHTADDVHAFDRTPRPWRPALAFLGDVDGDAETFLAELAVRAGPGLERLFECCESRPRWRGTLLEWMRAHETPAAARYVNFRGRTVRQIGEEHALQRFLAAALPDAIGKVGREDARALRRELLARVELERAAGRLALSAPERTPLGWRVGNALHLVGVPLAALAVSPFVLLASPLLLWRLRVHERRDPEIRLRPERAHVRTLSVLEDRDVTNQFNVIGDVKPGPFRRLLLDAALLVVDYGARHLYHRGYLARVRTIHFARWVKLDGGHRLYFASQYDGSLESYMDDFINKVAFGLNLVFSHGVGYPTTRWVIKGGAEREEAFKDTLRRHQLPSAVWYRAHPGLTVHDTARNARLRAGVEARPKGLAGVRRWLALI